MASIWSRAPCLGILPSLQMVALNPPCAPELPAGVLQPLSEQILPARLPGCRGGEAGACGSVRPRRGALLGHSP